MELRTRLWARSAGQSTGRRFAFGVSLLFFAVWGLGVGGFVYAFIDDRPDLTEQSIHAVCIGIFLMQVVLGMVSLAVAEFFDVSRLLHLPIGHREVFAAMAASGVAAPMALMYASPLIGAAVAIETDWSMIPWRGFLIMVQVALGHAVALLINLGFLNLFTRRRLRDVATILASIVGMGVYVMWQLAARGGASPDVVASFPVDLLRWLPTSWLADLFLARQAPGQLVLEGLGLFAFAGAVLWLGSRLLRRSFFGHMPSPVTRQRKDKEGWSFLPADIAAMVRTTRRTWIREPQVKAIWIQQTAFLLAPVVLVQLQASGGGAEDHAGIMAAMVPLVLPMSHLHFASNLFGLDGRGIVSTLLAPVGRGRVLVARGIAVGGFFLVSDFVVVVLILLASGLVSGFRADALTLAAAFRYVHLAPWLFIAVALTDIVLFAIGTITSVYLPSRIATPGRRPIQGQRVENAGCAAQLTRFVIFIPALVLGGGLSFVALCPVLGVFLPALDFGIAHIWGLVTIPVAFLVALGLYGTAVLGVRRALFEREEKIMNALVDRGD